MTNIAQQTLADIVISDHRAATIFEKHHLDFCCKGKRTLAEACAEKGFSIAEIAGEIVSINDTANQREMPFREMTAEQLISHILVHHHFYVKQAMPQLHAHLEKVVVKHGGHFPYMPEVLRLFAEVRSEMTHHMQKEEMVLFPAIKKAAAAFFAKEPPGNEARIIRGAVHVMEAEHDIAGRLLQQIQELTNNYHEPEGACITFKLSLAELKYFEEDLHRHVHLENNILFPMAKRFVE